MTAFFYAGQKDFIHQLNQLSNSATVQQSYYGVSATVPATRPDGSPRRVGDRYFDTTANAEKTWNGTIWFVPNLSAEQLASPDGTDYMGYAPVSGPAVKVTQRLRQFDMLYNPIKRSKKIVIFGSSVAAGYGAKNMQGWAYKLSVALAPAGYSIVNKSVAGNNAAALMGRFYSDVVSEHPDTVIVGMSLGNEGLVGSVNKEATYNAYINGIRALVIMCRERGYKVIVAGVYSNNQYTETDYQYLLQADQELENSDIPYVNFLGAVDDGTGKWRTGMWDDALHPNDAGHEAMYRAFPLSLIESLTSGLVYIPEFVNPRTIAVTEMLNGAIPIRYTSENDFGSFSVMCRIRRTAAGLSGKPLICMEHSSGVFQSVRLRNSIDVLELVFGNGEGGIVSTVSTSTFDEHCAMVTFNYFSAEWKLYIDGVFQGSAVSTPAKNQSYDTVVFGGRSDNAGFNSNGYEFSDFTVWRSALNQEQILEAAQGRISKASLNMYSPVVDALVPNGSRLVNLAPSTTYGRIESAGLVTFPSRQVITAPAPNSLVKTKSNGYLNVSLLDPAQPITASLLSGGVITAPGSFVVGVAGAGVQGESRHIITNNSIFYKVDGEQGSALGTALQIRTHSATNRSINAKGSVNTGGNDYAEYIYKCNGCASIRAGQIIGITANNTITDKWTDSIMFVIKSTAPAFVGGDTWSDGIGMEPTALAGAVPIQPTRRADVAMPHPIPDTDPAEYEDVVTEPGDSDEEWAVKQATYGAALAAHNVAVQQDVEAMAAFDAALEAARQKVDRIAIAGRVPVNVLGAQPGDYIVPMQDGAGIKGIAVREDDLTMKQYLQAVGRVISIEPDGRAYVMVKAV
ncbi:GDSL-type esterase/lipase family protein [Janthinobacterium sp. P210006]|uniref:GDSL-type esterase/lipase family protein n=1 Tax=Janthinobacterium sp. P210006 TaxID=3112939 RepID=UPI002E261ECE|nr:GDSL-type esterase/lipase family protein [Janthinobacterium sp. P210006]